MQASIETSQRPRENVYLGTSGWAYASWKPGFYPVRTSAKKMLPFYASQLNTVEVNYTFRQLPKVALIDRWLRQTPESFRFSFKAPQTITHVRRLRECGEALAAFRAAIAPAVDAVRFGVVLFQLPPTFKGDPERLDGFLQDAAGMGLRLAFEFRHASWFTDATFAILERHGAALCVAESDELQTPAKRTAPFTCYRLRKSEYSEAELHADSAAAASGR